MENLFGEKIKSKTERPGMDDLIAIYRDILSKNPTSKVI